MATAPVSVFFWVFCAVEGNPSGHFEYQKILIVNVREYAYVVPFVASESEIFLKRYFQAEGQQNYI